MTEAVRIPIVMPWRDIAEYEQLKQWFFPASNDPDMTHVSRQRAIARVRAYLVRGSVPHAVECTALLMSALIEDTPTANALSVRSQMAMSLIRFVNGMIDPHQKGVFATPMQVIARDIGLPTSLIDIRHTCTHENLPSLKLLRDGVVVALEWVYNNYWVVREEELTQTQRGNGVDRDEIKETFRQWRRLFRDNRHVTRVDVESPANKVEARMAHLVKQLIGYHEQSPGALYDVMVHQNVMVSKDSVHKSLLLPILQSLPSPILDGLFHSLVETAQRQNQAVVDSEELTLSASSPVVEWVEIFITEGLLSDPALALKQVASVLSQTSLEVLDVYLMHHDDAWMETVRQAMRDVVLSANGRLQGVETAEMVRLSKEYKTRLVRLGSAEGDEGMIALEQESGGPFTTVSNWTPTPVGVAI